MNRVSVSVNGETLDTFENGSIVLSMGDVCNTFELEAVTQPVPGSRLVRKGDMVEVYIDGGAGPEAVLAGYVDAINDRDTASALNMKFSGRSFAQDLVDSSAVTPDGNGAKVPMSWKKAKIDQIVSDLVAPFGITVFFEGNLGKAFPSFAVQKGERVIDTIQRAAIKRGLHCYSVVGDLVIAKAGTSRCNTVLERGVNVVEWEYTDSNYGRYSDYRLRAQARPFNTDSPAAVAQLASDVIDLGVTRYRPLLIQADAHDGLDLKGRGELERNLRAGQGETLSVIMLGWIAEADKHCWRPNMLVPVRNPVLEIDTTFLISTARYRFGPNEPESVQLELVLPAAYDSAVVYAENARSEKISKKAVKRASGQ